MEKRALARPIEALAFGAQKICLVSGPRQCGKTTLAKMLLEERKTAVYRNWDETEFRRAWTKSPSSVIPSTGGGDIPLVVLDEIHKDRRWKRNIKGVYDTLERPCDILVTGSARLNVYMKGSDSLLGRYLSFRLHPFSVREMVSADVLGPDAAIAALFNRAQRRRRSQEEHLASLMAYGPFPEPVLAQDARRARLWRRNREVLVIREDLRDLSRLPDLGRIELFATLLPERVGSPFSMSSVAEVMEVSGPTIKRWLSWLRELYYLFEVRPYSRKIARAIRREGKVYLWDYGAIPNEAARFENLVANHLLKACHYWTDTGEGEFDLRFLRNKEKQEIDFLVLRDGDPWLPVEVKHGDDQPSPNWRKFAPLLPCRRGLQLVRRPHWAVHEFGDTQVLVAGAAEALSYLA